MIKKHFIHALLILILVSCESNQEIPIVQNIHSNWIFKSKNSENWQSATVPGNVFSDLLDNQMIPDPFVKNNENLVQWVSDSTWIYKTRFAANKRLRERDHIEINFEGLDTYAKVYLNKREILSSNNAFRNYSVPVKDLLEEENTLRIEFKPTKSVEEKEKKKLKYELPEGNRVFTRKAQFQYGWDWGPKLNTSGIWKSVSIKSWNDAIITDVKIENEKKELGMFCNAFVTIKSDVQKKATLQMSSGTKLFNSQIELKKGTHTYKTTLYILKPKLWWPHNLGEPFLYDFNIQLFDGKTVLDRKDVKHGIRTIELISAKDSIGQSFFFKVNGVPVYAKGANYIPQHSFQNRVSNKRYEQLINDVVEANMNMLRVWGGGIYENDQFYELCDEKGILIWQDFMFACAMYPGDKSFLTNVTAEAEYQVQRLRNHPSIALWCGNNENSEGWHRWGWQAGKTEEQKKEIWDNYLKVFDSILPNSVHKFTSTSYWESSPKYGRGNPKYKTEGDAHDWWIWHDGFPFEHLENNVPRFMSEFGIQSFPSFQTINYINQKKSVDLQSKAIKSHQKHSRGFQLIEQYIQRDYPLPTKDEDYVYISQLVQAKGIVLGIEAQRRAKPYNMGTLYWQLNDCWPAISWSSIDYFGNWKALHYRAKKAFQNILISTTKSQYDYDTYIISDSLEDVAGTLKLKIIDFHGKVIWSNAEDITVKSNSSQKVYHIPQVDIYRAGYVYVIEFNDAKSCYYFEKPKNLKLPKSKIQYEVQSSQDGFTITLTSEVLEKNVFLTSNTQGHFSDNFFDILPNETLKIHFKSDAKEIGGLQIRTLNDLLSPK